MNLLNVQGLCKNYEGFALDNVSFKLDEGYIMGFIGRNGAGKTTTLKGIMNLIHTDGGKVEIFGREFGDDETEIKQDIGFMTGGSNYYPGKKLKTIGRAVRRFYPHWDEKKYQGYLERFGLDEEKKMKELSQGMGVKFSLALALSHNARLLILDEPTSGLDPAARDDLLELFQELVESGERSILFSTHITSDLEKCADYISFIEGGRLFKSCEKDDFLDGYRLVNGSADDLNDWEKRLIAFKKNSFGFTGLIEKEKLTGAEQSDLVRPNLEDIMIYFAKREAARG